MKNRRITLTSTQINSNSTIEIDPSLVWEVKDSFNQTIETQVLYPIAIQIINECGAGIEYNIIINERDYSDYLRIDSEDAYAFQRVPALGIVQPDHTNFPRCYKFLIRGYEVSATKNLIIEFINYR